MENMRKDMLSQQIMTKANEDEIFLKAFISATDALSVQQVLSENGIEITEEEVNEIFVDGVKEIQKYTDTHASGELSDEDLSEVAGGGFVRYLVRGTISAAAGFGFGCLCALCPAASVATPYVVGGLAIWCAAGYLKKGW